MDVDDIWPQKQLRRQIKDLPREHDVKSLNSYYRDVHSQRGEDEILEEVFKRIGIKNGRFVEFGAWDGIYLSNTRLLYENGWNGLFIESEPRRFMDLCSNYKGDERVKCLNSMVQESGDNSFDNLMDQHYDYPLDFVSIDIDGLDYYIFRSIERHLPKVICIECNQFLHPMADEVPRDLANDGKYGIGLSLRMFRTQAEKKGYKIICYTQNIIMVQEQYADLFEKKDLVSIYQDSFPYFKDIDWDYFNTVMREKGISNSVLTREIRERAFSQNERNTKERKVILITSDKYDYLLPGMAYLFNKYWSAEQEVIV